MIYPHIIHILITATDFHSCKLPIDFRGHQLYKITNILSVLIDTATTGQFRRPMSKSFSVTHRFWGRREREDINFYDVLYMNYYKNKFMRQAFNFQMRCHCDYVDIKTKDN